MCELYFQSLIYQVDEVRYIITVTGLPRGLRGLSFLRQTMNNQTVFLRNSATIMKMEMVIKLFYIRS